MLHAPTIALVGLSGGGKSTLGAALAARLRRPLVDTDTLIASAAGCTIADLFAAVGEAAFRDRETAALTAALVGPPCILATGGGIVLREANRKLLAQAFVVWLDAPDAVLLQRLAAHSEQRPLLADDPATRLAALRQARTPLYQAVAQLTIDTSSQSPDAIVAQIVQQVPVPTLE